MLSDDLKAHDYFNNLGEAQYSALEESAAILNDAELMDMLRKSQLDAESGKTIPWEEAKLRLGM